VPVCSLVLSISMQKLKWILLVLNLIETFMSNMLLICHLDCSFALMVPVVWLHGCLLTLCKCHLPIILSATTVKGVAILSWKTEDGVAWLFIIILPLDRRGTIEGGFVHIAPLNISIARPTVPLKCQNGPILICFVVHAKIAQDYKNNERIYYCLIWCQRPAV
jgi:hypothetical protein